MSGSRDFESVTIPKACGAGWDAMAGEGGKRFCQSCQRVVHDVSSLTRREAATLLRGSASGLCARISYDPQGRILFRHDPEARAKSRLVGISLLGVSALASQATAFAQAPEACTLEVKVSDVTGSPVSGSQVSLAPKKDTQAVRQGTTSADGLFRENVAAGQYQLRVGAPGFQQYAQDLNVSCDKPVPVAADVRLNISVLMGDVVIVDNHMGPVRRAWFRTRSVFQRLLRAV
jgi:hypothetical protein